MQAWRIVIRIISIFLILSAFLLTYFQWLAFQDQQTYLPQGTTAAGIPIGGLTYAQAEQRLWQAYDIPVELRYGDHRIHLQPEQVDFSLTIDAPFAAIPGDNRMQAFRDYLWGKSRSPRDIPVKMEVSIQHIRDMLSEQITPRYDHPPMPPLPLPASIRFQPGSPGEVMDIDAALEQIEAAFYSLDQRTVDLPIKSIDPPAPKWEHLEILLGQNIQTSGFQGVLDLYLFDLENNREIHLAFQDDRAIAVNPDIAYTASSFIKIPITVSVFRRLDAPPDARTQALLEEMFAFSSNESADALVKSVIDEIRGPLLVTQDMQTLGLENTFLAGYFELGSPLLDIFTTPANQRTDVLTSLDPYNQTTPSDAGRLLRMVYQCAADGSGNLTTAFPGEITQEECRMMIDLLKKDREPYLLTAGVPEGTPIAHKHGYYSTDNIINTINDAGILYTPGGDYVLAVFLDNRDLLLWDIANPLVARLSQTVYNFFNLSQP